MKTANATKPVVRAAKQSIILSVLLVLIVFSGRGNAQSNSQQFVAFQDFVANTATASSSDYLAQPASQVKDAAAFEQMRQHILGLYQGVQVDHSFVQDSQYFDCVPVAQQPSVRLLGITIAATPAAMPSGEDASAQANPAVEDALDEFGNSVNCEENTIPMRRITLDQLTRFATLDDFLQKGPDGAGQVGEPDEGPAPAGGKRYAHEYQTVNNLGGRSELSLWDLTVGPGDEFSLSQQWYVGGTGDARQTVEGGWIKYPKHFDKDHAVLFIFYTSKNYQKGFGCYNLECAAFVQTDNTWKLGGAFPKYSVSGGEQHWFSMEWYLVPNGAGEKNWWLLLKSDADVQWKWVGYYPEKIFDGGQMTKNAESIDYGGETDPDQDIWPPMGSGAWPDKGWTLAAYHSNIKYTDTSRNVKTPTLTPVQNSDNCYKVATPAVNNAAAWGTYFFFGGPGGKDCK